MLIAKTHDRGRKTKDHRLLQGPRDYREGVALYECHGLNLMLKRRFSMEVSRANHDILIDALRKLAGLSEAQLARMPRLSARPSEPVPDSAATVPGASASGGTDATATVAKVEGIRER